MIIKLIVEQRHLQHQIKRKYDVKPWQNCHGNIRERFRMISIQLADIYSHYK